MKKARKKRAAAKPPVESQVWWDDDLRQHAAGFAGDLDAVMNEAEKLDRWARQLRGYEQRQLPEPHLVAFKVTDAEAELLDLVYGQHSNDASPDKLQRLANAAHWLVTYALGDLVGFRNAVNRCVAYCKAEGLSQDHFDDAAVRASMAAYKGRIAANKKVVDDDDDDLPGGEWKKAVK